MRLYENQNCAKNRKTAPKQKKEPEEYCSSKKSYYICDREIMFNT